MKIVEGEASDQVVDIPRVNQDFLDQLVVRFSKSTHCTRPSTLPPEIVTNVTSTSHPKTKIHEEKSLKRTEYSTMKIVEGEASDYVVDIPRVNQDCLDQLVVRFSKSTRPSTLPPETVTNVTSTSHPKTKIHEEKSLKRAEYSTMEIVEGEASDQVVDIPRVNQDLLDQLVVRFYESTIPSTLPPETVTNAGRCIFRLPKRLKNINGKSLEPHVVALGPYHHGKPCLQIMEKLKLQCLYYLMAVKMGKLLECFRQLRPLEMEVRKCYSLSETDNLSTNELLLMMVVDGCFILMLFLRARLNLTELDLDETLYIVESPLYTLDGDILPKIYMDLLLLENQIPSCVLKTIYEILFDISSRKSLLVIATNFLCYISVIPKSRNMPTDGHHWSHLLGLVRFILISRRHNKKIWRTCKYKKFSPIPCVTKLCRAGITVKRHMADTFLDVRFKNGVIQMPDIILDDSMCSLLVNCVAFEQSCNISKHFSIYATFLDCLVNTEKDIDYLCGRGVIGSFLGTDEEAAQFINYLGKNLTIYNDRDSEFDVFGGVNKYYRKGLNWGKWTSFKSEYFGKPWLLISASAGFVLLVLTFLQTYYTIYAYYAHPKN